MATITPEGIIPKTLPEYKATLEANYSAIEGVSFDLSSNSPDGQLIVSFAQGYYELDQAQIKTWTARDPRLAEDADLDALAAHQKVIRYQNKKSITLIPCYGTGLLSKGHQIRDNQSGLTWTLIDDPLSLPSDGSFECEQAGPNYPSNDISIQTPESYWTSIGNPLSTSEGRIRESNAQLRYRRSERVAGPSQAMEDSILAAIWAVDDVTDVRAYINPYLSESPDGQPGKTYQVFVVGGIDDAIANAIYLSQPPLMNSIGNIEVNVITENNPYGRPVFFSRTKSIEVRVRLYIKGLENLDTTTQTKIKQTIVKYSLGGLDRINNLNFNYDGFRTGQNVDASSIYTPVNATVGEIATSNNISVDNIEVASVPDDGEPIFGKTAVMLRGEKGFILESSIELLSDSGEAAINE